MAFGARQGALLTRFCPARARTQAAPVPAPRARAGKRAAGPSPAPAAGQAAKPGLLGRLAGAAGTLFAGTAPAGTAPAPLAAPAPVALGVVPSEDEKDEEVDLGPEVAVAPAPAKPAPKAAPKRLRLNDKGTPAGTKLDIDLAAWVRSRRAVR